VGASPYLSEIQLFACNFAPRGYAFCSGQILPIAQNTALFSLLGTTYGGNGQTTFALPDLRGRVPVHPGQGPGLSNVSLGEVGGVETVTLTANQMPAHSHTANGTQAAATSTRPSGNVPSGGGAYNPTPDGSTLASGFIGSTGGSQPHENHQPYLGLNFCIAVEGLFPSRN
jgi:microcystin-dependent protein